MTKTDDTKVEQIVQDLEMNDYAKGMFAVNGKLLIIECFQIQTLVSVTLKISARFRSPERYDVPIKEWSSEECEELNSIVKDIFGISFYFTMRTSTVTEAEITYHIGTTLSSKNGLNARNTQFTYDVKLLTEFLLEKNIGQSVVEVVLANIQNGDKNNDKS